MMSNLGWYQKIVEIAKKVGGPKRLMAILFGSGALAGFGIPKIIKELKDRINNSKDNTAIDKTIIYKVRKEAKSKEGLWFREGEEIRILAVDGDAVFIEKIGDTNNPYVVAKEFIMSLLQVDKL